MSPNIVVAVLYAESPEQVTLFELAVDPPLLLWEDQRQRRYRGFQPWREDKNS